MTGELELDKGEIHSTSGTRIGYLAQTTFPDETLTVREDLEKVFEEGCVLRLGKSASGKRTLA